MPIVKPVEPSGSRAAMEIAATSAYRRTRSCGTCRPERQGASGFQSALVPWPGRHRPTREQPRTRAAALRGPLIRRTDRPAAAPA